MTAALAFALMLAFAAGVTVAVLALSRRRARRDAWRHIHFDDLHTLEVLQRRADFEAECG